MSKQLFILDVTASNLDIYEAGEKLNPQEGALVSEAEDAVVATQTDVDGGLATNVGDVITPAVEAVYAEGVNAIGQIAAGMEELAFSANGKTSVDVDSGELRRVENLVFSAGQQQTWTVDASAMDAEGCIKVIVTTPGTANLPMYSICATDAADFACEKDEFVITEASDTVTITAGINQHVRIACSGALEGVVAAAGTAYLPTTGTAADVAALEDACLPYDGVTNKVGFPVIKPASGVTAGMRYDIVVADFVTVSNAKHGMNALKGEKIKLIFACEVSLDRSNVDTSAADALTGALAKLK